MRGYLGTYYEEDSLIHYGIKGMKWGVRRFQKKDGTLTSAGKKRYSEDVQRAQKKYDAAKKELSKANADYNKATLGGLLYDQKAIDNLAAAGRKANALRYDLKDSKIYDRIKDRPKNDRTKKLEQKYRDEGMTEREATVAAYKRQRTEKVLVGALAVAATVAVAYAAKRHYDNTVDKIINPDELLHNISDKSNRGIEDAFYVARSAGDREKYRGMYGRQILARHDMMKSLGAVEGDLKLYDTAVKVGSENLKVASPKSATKVMKRLMESDGEFRDSALESMKEMANGPFGMISKAGRVQQKAIAKMQNGVFDGDVYEGLNIALVNHTTAGNDASKRLYDALKKAGYDAIGDLNDMKYSGYEAKSALIVFNGAAKASIESVKEIGKSQVDKDYAKAASKLTTKQLARFGAKVVAAGGAINVIQSLRESRVSETNQAIVQRYRKEHPNTKLSYREILAAENRS